MVRAERDPDGFGGAIAMPARMAVNDGGERRRTPTWARSRSRALASTIPRSVPESCKQEQDLLRSLLWLCVASSCADDSRRRATAEQVLRRRPFE